MISAIRVATSLLLGLMAACTTRPAAIAASGNHVERTPVTYVTGSRIPVPASDSRARAQSAQPIQSVDSQDIELSGQTNTADALRLLVPALSAPSLTGSSHR